MCKNSIPLFFIFSSVDSISTKLNNSIYGLFLVASRFFYALAQNTFLFAHCAAEDMLFALWSKMLSVIVLTPFIYFTMHISVNKCMWSETRFILSNNGKTMLTCICGGRVPFQRWMTAAKKVCTYSPNDSGSFNYTNVYSIYK